MKVGLLKSTAYSGSRDSVTAGHDPICTHIMLGLTESYSPSI